MKNAIVFCTIKRIINCYITLILNILTMNIKKHILVATLLFLQAIPAYSQLIISSNTTWTGSIFLSQKVIVNQGVTLTIEPSTNVLIGYVDANGDNIGDVEIEVNGKINVNGNLACAPVIFGPLNTTTNNKHWKGIKINSNVINDSIFGAIIYNAETPFNVLTNATIRDCKIRSFDNIGINFTPLTSNVILNIQSSSVKQGKLIEVNCRLVGN